MLQPQAVQPSRAQQSVIGPFHRHHHFAVLFLFIKAQHCRAEVEASQEVMVGAILLRCWKKKIFFVCLCTIGNVTLIRAISECRRARKVNCRRFPASYAICQSPTSILVLFQLLATQDSRVGLMSSLLRLAGSPSCVICCKTCYSPTSDRAWHRNIAQPTQSYITICGNSRVSLLSLHGLNKTGNVAVWWEAPIYCHRYMPSHSNSAACR